MNILSLSGLPGSGKSEVAKILQARYGALIVDDGVILRNAIPFLFEGVDPADTFTQEGKRKIVTVCGKEYTVRQLLGHVGQLLEDFYGEFYIAEQTMLRLARLPAAPLYVLPSVRKSQPGYYHSQGAVVAEVVRPGTVPTGNAFDRFDVSMATDRIDNSGNLQALDREVQRFMAVHFRMFPCANAA